MKDYFDSATGRRIDVAETEGLINRTDEMLIADKQDLKIGQLVYLGGEQQQTKVLPHKLRGKIQSYTKMLFVKENGEKEWAYEEPDWSYNAYRRTIAKMLNLGIIYIHERDKERNKRISRNTTG